VLECDTHVTKDGEVVVCHDQTINSTPNGSGDITNMTLAEIKSYNMTDRNGRVTEEKIPTLEEFLKAGRGRVYYNLDYSPRTASTKQVVDIVTKLDMTESVIFYCNSAAKATEVLSMLPKAHICTWQGQHKPLIGLPGNYFAQYSYLTGGKSTPLGTAVNDGMLVMVNMLNSTGSLVSEWSLDETFLDELLSIYPMTHMIQTDVPAELLSSLQARGLR
ncbi:MAG: glycerophosphodiester phosphodiesterase family protein, partial [Muribaculaceae bacterium]|nr:glycerophosphodiester phosphodiesterase family protein [Muribaculaceae bacterium]